MFRNYVKIAFRQLIKNKTFSIINISGLAIGMASVILISVWVSNELSYDTFHEKRDRIYELWNKGEWSGEMQCWNTTPRTAPRYIKKDIPEVEKTARVDWKSVSLFAYKDKKLNGEGHIVDPEFFDIFSFPLKTGNVKTGFKDPNSILITEKFAQRIFGDEDPIGKTIKRNNEDDFVVRGIVKDLPVNTRFDFEFLIPWSFNISKNGDEDNWGNNSVRNYVLLKENVSVDLAQRKIKGLRKKYQENYDGIDMFLYPLERWQMYSVFEQGVEQEGRIKLVRLFMIIGAFILLIACINFMNLSTARSEKRAKEVGIRKAVGAFRIALIKQFLGESLFLVFISFIIALGLSRLALPYFNDLVLRKLNMDFGNVYFWMASLVFILITGLLAGFYPAFYLSSFKPVLVLKGTFKKVGALVTPRKVLVVVQFGFAVVLIIATIIVRQQIAYVQERDSGYRKDNLLYHYLSNDLQKNYTALRNDLMASGSVEAVAKTSSPLTQGWSDSWGFEWEGKDPNDKTDFDRFSADEGIVNLAGLQLVKGRDLDLKKFISDSSSMIINESALKAMKFKDPIGQVVKDGDISYKVIGVVKDFILHSPYYPTRPMLITGAMGGWFNVVHVRLKPGNRNDHMKKVEEIFNRYNPQFTFDCRFIDEEYGQKFVDEQRTASFATIFAGLAIFISCLGLFGLAAYMAENRIKEIGIRKVLGASVVNIASLLTSNFLKLVFISILIAAPLSWWLMNKWLSDFPYRISIQWWVFALAGAISLFIALLTVSFQSIKAATAKPIKSLRTE